MSIPAFLRKNIVAVIGVVLPLLLVLLLAGVRGIATLTVPEPAHDLLLASQGYGDRLLEFSVEHGALRIRYLPPPPEAEWPWQTDPRLYYLDVARQVLRPIAIELPRDPDGRLSAQPRQLELPELAGLALSADSVAPDGYRFEPAGRYQDGLFGVLFGSGYRRHYALVKNGRRIVLPVLADHHDLRPVGWVIAGELEE